MIRFKKNHSLVALTYSLLLTVILWVMQILMPSEAEVLGQNFSSLKGGLIELYGSIIFTEILKILCLQTLFFFPFILAFRLLKSKNPRSSSGHQILSVSILIMSYCLFWASSVLKYPAVYENYLSQKILKAVYSASFHTSPNFLLFLSLLSMFSGYLFLVNKRYIRQSVSTTAGVLISFLLTSSSPNTKQLKTVKGDSPLVLLIGIDSLRNDRFRSPLVMPNMNSLQEEVSHLNFKNHYVGTPRTFPSWLEILTGQFGASNGVRHMFPSLPEINQPRHTLGHSLKQNGYSTTVISDFAGDIFPRFDSGFNQVNAPELTIQSMLRMNVDLMYPVFLPVILQNFVMPLFKDLAQSPILSNPDFLTEKAISIIDDNKKKSQFVTIFYSTAHFPYAAPWPYYSKFSSTDYHGRFLFQKNPDVTSKGKQPNNAEIEKINQLYDGSLAAIDHSLKQLFDYLKASNLWDKTLLVITADHGEDLFEEGMIQGHGEHLKGENVIKVPLFIKPPKNFTTPKHIDVNSFSRSIDIMPTILDMLAIDINLDLDGRSLLDKNEQSTIISSYPYSETGIWFSNNDNGFFQDTRIRYPGISFMLNFDPGNTGQVILNKKYEHTIVTSKHRSIIVDNYKLIYLPTNKEVTFELYDIIKDPQNKYNLIEKEPEVTSKMKDILFEKILSIEKQYHLANKSLVPK